MKSATKTKAGTIDTITVSVQDTEAGSRPIVVEWPLVKLRFASLEEVREAISPFGQFNEVDSRVKQLVGECLTELGCEPRSCT